MIRTNHWGIFCVSYSPYLMSPFILLTASIRPALHIQEHLSDLPGFTPIIPNGTIVPSGPVPQGFRAFLAGKGSFTDFGLPAILWVKPNYGSFLRDLLRWHLTPGCGKMTV